MDQVKSPTKADTLAKIKDAPRHRKLVIKGLQKSFGGKVVYDGFDLELELGTFTSVFGPNGCGKSTLINMISGLMPRHQTRDHIDQRAFATAIWTKDTSEGAEF